MGIREPLDEGVQGASGQMIDSSTSLSRWVVPAAPSLEEAASDMERSPPIVVPAGAPSDDDMLARLRELERLEALESYDQELQELDDLIDGYEHDATDVAETEAKRSRSEVVDTATASAPNGVVVKSP